ncbi:MAG: sugar ABC transporter permease [Oscillospiraceae bacterium]|nr:sugar ABC transporter permease [Oscillospiraceae bacterium]
MKKNALKRSENYHANNIYPNKYLYYYLTPAVVMLVALCAFPLLVLIYNSFTDMSMVKPVTNFVGLRNFRKLLTNPDFWNRFVTTMKYVVSAVVIEMVLGFTIALLFQIKLRAKKLLRLIIIIPMVAAPVAMCFLWTIMFNPKMGILNYLLSLINIPPQMWTSSPDTALFSVILVEIWMNTPFVFLLVSSGMTALPQELFEAAVMDGAGFWQMLRKMLLPLLSPVLSIAFLFRLQDSFKVFDIIYVLTGGGPGTATETMNISIYKTAFQYSRIGSASAQALLLYIFVFAMSYFIIKRGNIGFD